MLFKCEEEDTAGNQPDGPEPAEIDAVKAKITEKKDEAEENNGNTKPAPAGNQAGNQAGNLGPNLANGQAKRA